MNDAQPDRGANGYRLPHRCDRCGLDAGREIDRLQRVGNRRALQEDGRVAVAVGDEVAADAEPVGTFAANGAAAFLNVMVLPLTFRVEPS
jgi:hypothetical protein